MAESKEVGKEVVELGFPEKLERVRKRRVNTIAFQVMALTPFAIGASYPGFLQTLYYSLPFWVLLILSCGIPIFVIASIVLPDNKLKDYAEGVSKELTDVLSDFKEGSEEFRLEVENKFGDIDWVLSNPVISYTMIHEPVSLSFEKRKVSPIDALKSFQEEVEIRKSLSTVRNDIPKWLKSSENAASSMKEFRKDYEKISKTIRMVLDGKMKSSGVPEDVMNRYEVMGNLWLDVNHKALSYSTRINHLNRILEIAASLSLPEETMNSIKEMIPNHKISKVTKKVPSLKTASTVIDLQKTAADADLAVSKVKIAIGTLRTDIGWVIDNPAFFDTNSAATTKLFELLAEWDDSKNASPSHKISLSENIEQEFQVSKRLAEKLGLGYLHGEAKRKMQTASKLTHKAESTTSAAEKSALMAKVAKIMSEVISVTVPEETKKAIEANVSLALPYSTTGLFNIEEEPVTA